MPLPTRDTLPSYRGEAGLAGLCLEPRHGYVFATFAYADSTGVLRNGMARFETRPGRFALTPISKVLFTSPFDADVAAISHQIGPCQATAGGVYVSVGDGEEPKRSRDLQSTLGKVLRLTFDGPAGRSAHPAVVVRRISPDGGLGGLAARGTLPEQPQGAPRRPGLAGDGPSASMDAPSHPPTEIRQPQVSDAGARCVRRRCRGAHRFPAGAAKAGRGAAEAGRGGPAGAETKSSIPPRGPGVPGGPHAGRDRGLGGPALEAAPSPFVISMVSLHPSGLREVKGGRALPRSARSGASRARPRSDTEDTAAWSDSGRSWGRN